MQSTRPGKFFLHRVHVRCAKADPLCITPAARIRGPSEPPGISVDSMRQAGFFHFWCALARIFHENRRFGFIVIEIPDVVSGNHFGFAKRLTGRCTTYCGLGKHLASCQGEAPLAWRKALPEPRKSHASHRCPHEISGLARRQHPAQERADRGNLVRMHAVLHRVGVPINGVAKRLKMTQ